MGINKSLVYLSYAKPRPALYPFENMKLLA